MYKNFLLYHKHKIEHNRMRYLLQDDILTNAKYVDTIKCHNINHSSNMLSLINTNMLYRTCKMFIQEGLIKTYPTKTFCKLFKTLIDTQIPNELKTLTFKDVGLIEYGEQYIYMTTEQTYEVDKISGQIAFVIPIYKSDERDFKIWLDNNIEKLYVNGYLLTSIDKLDHELKPEIDILIIQFEAKFPSGKFKLADILLHVTPYKYLEKIKKYGLVPKSKSSEFKYDSRVYLFNQCKEQLAIDYGQFKAKQHNDTKFCVFKILRKNLENNELFKLGKLNFYIDYAFETDINIEAIFTYGNIPLSLLEDTCLIVDSTNPNIRKSIIFK